MKKIVVIGPESTGKSTLCSQLASHYKTVWCPEYAREYLVKNGMAYGPSDLDAIALGQQALEATTAATAGELLFIDTNMYVLKVWYEVAFGHCPTAILKAIAKKEYQLYLLCDIDLPWTADDLRKYPDLPMRQRLFKMYKDVVINSGVPWAIVNGNNQQRLQSAVQSINTHLYS